MVVAITLPPWPLPTGSPDAPLSLVLVFRRTYVSRYPDEDEVARRAGHQHGDISCVMNSRRDTSVDVVISVTRHPLGLLVRFSLFVHQVRWCQWI
jgi:hypothetical protein